ncbi:MAG: hypothetical protein EHM36_08210 [Deltaproteobacteria bacterium]|nr:MAG: hypothetical protein EHM36_08210 [Deltaproteobacteria bacterium]
MYNILDIIRNSRQLAGQEMNRAVGYSSGKLNPWDDPRWRPMVEGMRTQGSRSLEDLSRMLNLNKVTGPAAGLVLEKGQNGINGNLLNLVNLLKGNADQTIGDWEHFDEKTRAMALQKKMHDDEMQAQKMQMITNSIMSGIKMLAGGISGGIGGGGMGAAKGITG